MSRGPAVRGWIMIHSLSICAVNGETIHVLVCLFVCVCFSMCVFTGCLQPNQTTGMLWFDLLYKPDDNSINVINSGQWKKRIILSDDKCTFSI